MEEGKVGARDLTWVNQQTKILQEEGKGIDEHSRIYSIRKDGFIHVDEKVAKDSSWFEKAIASVGRFFTGGNYDIRSDEFKDICKKFHNAVKNHESELTDPKTKALLHNLDNRLRHVAVEKKITFQELKTGYEISTPTTQKGPTHRGSTSTKSGTVHEGSSASSTKPSTPEDKRATGRQVDKPAPPPKPTKAGTVPGGATHTPSTPTPSKGSAHTVSTTATTTSTATAAQDAKMAKEKSTYEKVSSNYKTLKKETKNETDATAKCIKEMGPCIEGLKELLALESTDADILKLQKTLTKDIYENAESVVSAANTGLIQAKLPLDTYKKLQSNVATVKTTMKEMPKGAPETKLKNEYEAALSSNKLRDAAMSMPMLRKNQEARDKYLAVCKGIQDETIGKALTRIGESAGQEPQDNREWLENTISSLSKDIATVSKWRTATSALANSETIDHALNDSRAYLLMRSLEYADSVIHSGSDISHAEKILNNVEGEINKIPDENYKALFQGKLDELSVKPTTATTTSTTTPPKSRRESISGGEAKKPLESTDIGIEFTAKDFEGLEGVTDAEMERTTELEKLFTATDKFPEASVENEVVLDDKDYLDKVMDTLDRLTALSEGGRTDTRIEGAKKQLNKLAGSYIKLNVTKQEEKLNLIGFDNDTNFKELSEGQQQEIQSITEELSQMGESLKNFRLKPDLSKQIRETIDECMEKIHKPFSDEMAAIIHDQGFIPEDFVEITVTDHSAREEVLREMIQKEKELEFNDQMNMLAGLLAKTTITPQKETEIEKISSQPREQRDASMKGQFCEHYEIDRQELDDVQTKLGCTFSRLIELCDFMEINSKADWMECVSGESIENMKDQLQMLVQEDVKVEKNTKAKAAAVTAAPAEVTVSTKAVKNTISGEVNTIRDEYRKGLKPRADAPYQKKLNDDAKAHHKGAAFRSFQDANKAFKDIFSLRNDQLTNLNKSGHKGDIDSANREFVAIHEILVGASEGKSLDDLNKIYQDGFKASYQEKLDDAIGELIELTDDAAKDWKGVSTKQQKELQQKGFQWEKELDDGWPDVKVPEFGTAKALLDAVYARANEWSAAKGLLASNYKK